MLVHAAAAAIAIVVDVVRIPRRRRFHPCLNSGTVVLVNVIFDKHGMWCCNIKVRQQRIYIF